MLPRTSTGSLRRRVTCPAAVSAALSFRMYREQCARPRADEAERDCQADPRACRGHEDRRAVEAHCRVGAARRPGAVPGGPDQPGRERGSRPPSCALEERSRAGRGAHLLRSVAPDRIVLESRGRAPSIRARSWYAKCGVAGRRGRRCRRTWARPSAKPKGRVEDVRRGSPVDAMLMGRCCFGARNVTGHEVQCSSTAGGRSRTARSAYFRRDRALLVFTLPERSFRIARSDFWLVGLAGASSSSATSLCSCTASSSRTRRRSRFSSGRRRSSSPDLRSRSGSSISAPPVFGSAPMVTFGGVG